MQVRVRVLAWLALGLGPLTGQGGMDATVRRIDGTVHQGAVTVAEDGTVTVVPASGPRAAFQLDDVLAIEPMAPAAASGSKPPLFVWLRSGSSFPAATMTGREAKDGPAAVSFGLPSGGEITVPLRYVAAVRIRDVEPATFAADRKTPERNLDYLYVVKDGVPQRFSVAVSSVHDGRVHFDLRGKSYDFPLFGGDGTAAIVFGVNTGFPPDVQGKPRAAVATTSGVRLEGRLLAVDSVVRLRLDEGVQVELPSGSVQRIDVSSDKLAWLGNMRPQVEQTPAFDRVHPFTVDRSPAGPGILIDGVSYERGIVMVPRTRLVYDLGGRYDVFEASIGIDDRGGPQANAVFRVLVDGKVAFESQSMTRGKPAQALRIELGRCRELAIEADFGLYFDLGDLCAFADARVAQR